MAGMNEMLILLFIDESTEVEDKSAIRLSNIYQNIRQF